MFSFPGWVQGQFQETGEIVERVIAQSAHQVVEAHAEESANPESAGKAANAGGMEGDDPAEIEGAKRLRGFSAQAAGEVAAGVFAADVCEVDGFAQGRAAMDKRGGIARGEDVRIVWQRQIGVDDQATVPEPFDGAFDFGDGEGRAGRPAEKHVWIGLAPGNGGAAVVLLHGGAGADFHLEAGKEIEYEASMPVGQKGQDSGRGIDDGCAAFPVGGKGSALQAGGEFEPGETAAGHEQAGRLGVAQIGVEIVADAQGVGEGCQRVRVFARKGGVETGGGRSGGDQQMGPGNGFAARDEGVGIEIDGLDGALQEADVGGEVFGQRALDPFFGDPAAGKFGQGGQHGGDGTGVDQHDFRVRGVKCAAGLLACETSTDDDRFVVHDLANYCRLMEMQKLQAEIEKSWRRQLDEHPFWNGWAVASPGSFALVRETLLTPGKRLRPTLFCLGCRAFGREPLPDLLPAALALELVHNFILIHDDVMDRSEMRRGMPTLPQRMEGMLAGKPSGGFCGADLALVAGDLLYTMAMESLLRTAAPAERVAEAMREFMRAAMNTGRGALMEVRAAQASPAELSTQAIEPLYALKTGSYSFALPMRLAALFAGGEGRSFPFEAFGASAGIAYQLKNDRDSLRAWLGGGGVPDDVRDSRRTWAMVHAWHAADEAGREALVGPPVDEIKGAYERTGTLEALDEAIRGHGRVAIDLVPEGALRDYLAAALGV